ncbi:hypothetical protein Pmar_PMAR028914 [Perkinsus marinus ATCC 50983]|uniref:Uncharacterized protein n=1 Tax=Perkinsus marinus (strain ATCC 50983 / TXsc) TaxID=423536 RepID=C5LPX7_PERM5|nr:hypothetical protein Pmar_PMAR028914 [Perkinsus marinus ATCC 50983]EER01216.1 hypothetical protein Pmar_PMAR028914 [Perkinsus marinus ATCC 50983]|eukprot:XP_002768498.1 hypothetical protein Pmar_PMAR028914 [Perkinsus marinus ATCC 50983]
MARVQALPNRPYKYVLTANSADYSKHEEVFGGIAKVLSESAVDGNTNYEAQGQAFRYATYLTEFGFTEVGKTNLDGTPARVLVGYAANMPGGDTLDGFAKEGLGADFFTVYMDGNVDGKVLKMEARNSYMGNELYQEVLVTAYGELKGDMSLKEAVDELHATYASSVEYNMSAQNPFVSSAFHTHSTAIVSGKYLSEAERLFYSAYERRWSVLDWMKNGRGARGLRNNNASSIFQPIKYFGIEPNSAAEEYFKDQNHGRHLQAVLQMAFPAECSLTKKPDSDIFCVHAGINTKDSTIDVKGSLFDHYSPDEKRISAGFILVQESKLAVDLHISGGGTAVVFATDGEVRLEATAGLQILDGGNPRHSDGPVKIACGYELSGSVSLKAGNTDLLTATFGGVGVVGGGADNLIGNYIPLEGGLDALVTGFIVKGTFLVQSTGGSFLKYTLDFPVAYGIWAPFYSHTGSLSVFNHEEINLFNI